MLIAPSNTVQKSSQVSTVAEVMFSITPSLSRSEWTQAHSPTLQSQGPVLLILSGEVHSCNQFGESLMLLLSERSQSHNLWSGSGQVFAMTRSPTRSQKFLWRSEINRKWWFESSSGQSVKCIPVKQLPSLKEAVYSTLYRSSRSAKWLHPPLQGAKSSTVI